LPFAVQPGQTRQFTLAYAPASAGTTTESVIIANDDGNENPYTLTVRGTGQTPAPSMRVRRGSTEIPDGTSLGYDFGPVHAGASSQPVAFTIDNTAGSAQLFISELTCSSAEFAVDYTGFTSSVPAGGTTLFRLRFSPGDTGQETATLTISNNDPAPGKNPYTFNVRGTGTTPPNVELSVWADGTKRPAGSTISFGQVDVGSHSPVAFSVLNEGPESLVLSYVIKTDGTTTDFGVDIAGTLMGQPIPPGGSTTFTVTFAPSASGHSWCELEIGSNAVTNPYVLRLEGSGHDDDLARTGPPRANPAAGEVHRGQVPSRVLSRFPTFTFSRRDRRKASSASPPRCCRRVRSPRSGGCGAPRARTRRPRS
jgi:hypothetical protein